MEPKGVKECQKEELHSLAREDRVQTQGLEVYMATSTHSPISEIFLISKTNLARLGTTETQKLLEAAELSFLLTASILMEMAL